MIDRPANARIWKPATAQAKALSMRERQVLRLIRASGTLTRSNLIKRLDLSGPAIFRVTEDLSALGLIEIGGGVAQGPGQPSSSVHLAADSVVTAGLSVATDAAEAVMINLAGDILGSANLAVEDMTRATILPAFERFIDQTLDARGLDRTRLGGLGVGVSGYFLEDGVQINTPPELDDWALVDLPSLLGRQFHCPAFVENIARAAAIGEALLGAGTWAPSFGFINITAGLGGAIVIDGELVRGRLGNAGEIGAIPEILGYVKPDLPSLIATLRDHDVPVSGIRDLLDRYDDNWPGVEEWIERMAPPLSLVASFMQYLLDVDAVVVGGRLPRPVISRLVAAMRLPEEPTPPRRGHAKPAPQIVPAVLGPTAAAIGAASAFLKHQYF